MSSNLELFKQLSELTESSSESDTNTHSESSSDDELILLELALVNIASQKDKSKENSSTKQYKQIKSREWCETILFNYDETRFRRTLRMSKSTFHKLLGQISNHEVFKSTGNKPQKSPAFQLAVTLRRLGSKCDVFEIASKFGISEGSVAKYQ